MFNVMLAKADDIKMIEKRETNVRLPIEVRQVCVKFVGLFYGVID